MHPELIKVLLKSVLFCSLPPLPSSLSHISLLSRLFKLQSQLSSEQKKAALPSVPSLLEVCGFSYFYGGFLVGPQFTLRSYQRLVAGELSDCPGKPPNRLESEEYHG